MLVVVLLIILGWLIHTNERITNLQMSTDSRFADANAELDALDEAVADVEGDNVARDAEIADLKQEVADLIANSGMSADDSAALTSLVERIATVSTRVKADGDSFPAPPAP